MWDAIKNDFECHTLLDKFVAAGSFPITMESEEKLVAYISSVKQLSY